MPRRPKQYLSLARAVLLAIAEDWRNVVYNDIDGSPTIGVGHLLTPSERTSGKVSIAGRNVYWGKGLSDIEVAQLFAQDVALCEESINNLVKVPLEQHQFDALVLFIFNVGRQAFAQSTLLRLLNLGEYVEVPKQLRRWVYSDGKIIKGLKNRREEEVAIWNNQE